MNPIIQRIDVVGVTTGSSGQLYFPNRALCSIGGKGPSGGPSIWEDITVLVDNMFHRNVGIFGGKFNRDLKAKNSEHVIIDIPSTVISCTVTIKKKVGASDQATVNIDFTKHQIGEQKKSIEKNKFGFSILPRRMNRRQNLTHSIICRGSLSPRGAGSKDIYYRATRFECRKFICPGSKLEAVDYERCS